MHDKHYTYNTRLETTYCLCNTSKLKFQFRKYSYFESNRQLPSENFQYVLFATISKVIY